MLAQVTSGAVLGVDAYRVRVEVDLARGLPCMNVVGLPESAVREGRERVMAAVGNSGYSVPPRRVTVNLAPADVRKEGSAFDLPIALGLLAGLGAVPVERLAGICFVGELGLDGDLRGVRGVLPLALRCRSDGPGTLVIPEENAGEAAVVEGLDVRAAGSLNDVVRHLTGAAELDRVDPRGAAGHAVGAVASGLDFADIQGQAHAKRALEIAAAGSHNVLLIGPPGSGKSMLARRLPTIFPPLSTDEALETTKVHSVAGRLRRGQSLIRDRPFRAPHHTVSDSGMVGGGAIPRPGEISLAHNGVLFLDEMPEFRRPVLEALRQPLEDGTMTIGRARGVVTYPARFMLVAAMNPCPCGYFGAGEARCTCHDGQVRRYLARISGPLLDRIDLHVEVPPPDVAQLTSRRRGEASASIRARVVAARARQTMRFRDRPHVFANGQMGPADVRAFCRLDEAGEALLLGAVRRLGFSARAYHRVLKVARTIADLDGRAGIAAADVAEAVQYRSLDRVSAAAAPAW